DSVLTEKISRQDKKKSTFPPFLRKTRPPYCVFFFDRIWGVNRGSQYTDFSETVVKHIWQTR
ncbi:MAG: hypothetical protein LBN39_05295, partial [Planctomycetaceae bacterium]|nr:hypothetical protein [Planctomycetaceae bacterium]